MINVPVPLKSYGIYATAVRLIALKLGPAAPTTAALIQHELSLRDPASVAEEYLHHARARKGPRAVPGHGRKRSRR